MYPGRSEAQKQQLADAIVKDVVNIAQCEESSVSVAIEEVDPKLWSETVYRVEIMENNKLYKKPGYTG
jgi:4-oxalocrotonate tautomerase